MGFSHSENRMAVIQGFEHAFKHAPALPVAQLLHAVGQIETSCGMGWKGAGVGSNNWGAIQKGSWRGETFEYTDTHPNPDGTSTKYKIAFRKYPSRMAGAADLARVVYKVRKRDESVLVAAQDGDSLGFSQAMYETGYYEGFGRTKADRIHNHHKAILRALNMHAKELGERLPGGEFPLPATIRRGSRGPVVMTWQRIAATPVDGAFGPNTEAATKSWQSAYELKADGIVGPKTWGKALEKEC